MALPGRQGGGLQDDFARRAWDTLHSGSVKTFSETETHDNRTLLRYAVADVMHEDCLACHNSHAESPKRDWALGDISGIVEVGLPLDVATAQSKAWLRFSYVYFAVLTGFCITGIALTFTGLRRSSEELRKANVQLSGEVEERLRAEEGLEELIVRLEEKNAELEQFSYSVSHDLKSPLFTILGYAGGLEKAALRGDLAGLRSDVGQIENASKRMAQLLDELLELSRVGRVLTNRTALALSEVVKETLELCRASLDRIDVDVAPDLPVVFGNRTRLVQVFQNLIENAAKFGAHHERPRIEIGAHRQGDEVLCFVRDNGIGIDEKYAEKIFGLFEQLDPSHEGTGVGLTLVRRIVESHGGRVRVESEGVGRGATFRFTLPAPSDSSGPAISNLTHD